VRAVAAARHHHPAGQAVPRLRVAGRVAVRAFRHQLLQRHAHQFGQRVAEAARADLVGVMHLAIHIGHQHGFGRRFEHGAHARFLVQLALADIADDAAGLGGGAIGSARQHGAARQQPAPVAVAVAQAEFAVEGARRLAVEMLAKRQAQARAVVAVYFGQPVGQRVFKPGLPIAQHVLVQGRKQQLVGLALPGPGGHGRATQGLRRMRSGNVVRWRLRAMQLPPQAPRLPARPSRQGRGAGRCIRPQQHMRRRRHGRLRQYRQGQGNAGREHRTREPAQRTAPGAWCAGTRVAAIRQMHPFLGRDWTRLAVHDARANKRLRRFLAATIASNI